MTGNFTALHDQEALLVVAGEESQNEVRTSVFELQANPFNLEGSNKSLFLELMVFQKGLKVQMNEQFCFCLGQKLQNTSTTSDIGYLLSWSYWPWQIFCANQPGEKTNRLGFRVYLEP